MKTNKQQIPSHTLILGENDKRNNVYIQEQNRMKHLVVVGTKGSGKSKGVLPALAKQDFEDKKTGATIVVGEKETAMLLFALAKRAGRDVLIIKPSLTDTGKLLLMHRNYDYGTLKQDILDYEKAVTKKQIVIIDMEFARHGKEAIRGVAYLMNALHEAVVKVNDATVTKHFLYVDDAQLYLPYLKGLLHVGKDFGVGCTLFMESRLQLVKPEERALVDSYVGNTLLMSGLTLEGAKYYVEDIYEKQIPFMRNRALNEFIYSTTDGEGRRTTGHAKFGFLPDEMMQSIRMAIPRYRGGIEREQVGVAGTEMPSVRQATPEPYSPLTSVASAPEPARVSTPIKLVTEPTKPVIERAASIEKTVEANSNRHVVIMDNLFDEDEEY